MMGKRYFWLKLQEDFFSSLRIKKLRKIAGGDTYTIIYLKMQLKALKTDGLLKYTGVENSFAEELALDLDEDPDNVAVALSYLAGCGLIETSDDINYFLPYVKANTGSETASARRVRDFRERQAEALPAADAGVTPALPDESTALHDRYSSVTPALQCNALQCNTDVTNMKRTCNAEKEREIEIDIDPSPNDLYSSIHSGSISAREADVENVENVDNSPKFPFGSQRNVCLTMRECDALAKQFPLDYARRIEVLSAYLAAHPEKQYDSHYATILLWDARDKAWQQKADVVSLGKAMGFEDDAEMVIGLREAKKIMAAVPAGLEE